jgi:hypothetical protein
MRGPPHVCLRVFAVTTVARKPPLATVAATFGTRCQSCSSSR